MIRLRTMLIAGLISIPSIGASAAIQRQHGAHVHGTTTIDIASDGKLLSFKFEMPGVNAVGYEHPPHSAEERAQLRCGAGGAPRAGHVVDSKRRGAMSFDAHRRRAEWIRRECGVDQRESDERA